MFKKKCTLASVFLFLVFPCFSQILLQESFDNKVFPPAGWTNQKTVPGLSTTDNLWERVAVSNNPAVPAHSGTGMAFYNSYTFNAGTKTELATAALDFSAGGPISLKFWMYRDGSGISNNDLIEIYVNTLQGAGGNLLGSIPRSYDQSPAAVAPGWYQYSFTIPAGYTSNVNYIIFRAASAAGNNMFIDDVEVAGPVAVSCYYPTNIDFTSITNTAAAISWNAPAQSTPSSYEWEIRTGGLPGSGNSGLVNSGTVNTTAADITGLTANTNYNIYVRSSCGSSKSIWVGPFNFKTACSLNAIPFAENFDGVAAPALPNCFTVENRNSGNTWINTNLGSSSFSAYSSPNAMVFASASATAGEEWLYTPALSLTAAVNYRMQFWYKALFSGFANKIEIKFGNAPVASAMTSSVIYSNNNITNTAFQQASFTYTVPQTGVYYIGIHNITPAGAYNYQMLLDNLFIDIGPDPNCGIASGLFADSIGLNAATVRWTAPANGTPVSYDWELRTSGLAGSGATGLYKSGNISALDTIRLTGLTMGTTYKYYLKTNCTNPSYGLWSSGISFTTLTTACAEITGLTISNITKNGFRGYWSAPVVSSRPVAYDWEVRTSGGGGSGAAGLVSNGSTDSLYVDITGLNANSPYAFYVKTRCVSGNNSLWTFKSLTTTIENDICTDAIDLVIGKGFCTSSKVVDLSIATPSAGLSNSCALINNGSGTTNSMKDAWFKITIPATGNAIVQTQTVLKSNLYNFTSNNINNMLIAYSGSCGSLTEIACDLDGAPDDYWGFNTYQAKIALTGRTPGEVIYLRLLPDARNSPFVYFETSRAAIGAWDTTSSVHPAVSTGGNCVTNPSINFGTVVNTDNYFKWNPIFDSEGKIVAEISPNNPIGTVSTSTFVNNNGPIRTSAGGRSLLNRNLSFSVQSQPSTYSAYLRIYYKKEELQKLKAIDPNANYDFLEVIKTNALCNNGVVSGAETIITPTAFGKYGDDYYVEMIISDLSNFYITASTNVSKICPGANTSLVSNISGSSFQWQVNTGSGFQNISNGGSYSGTTTSTLQINNAPVTFYGYQYRCFVDNYFYSKVSKLQFVNTWTGAIDNKWETPGNWSCGMVPDASLDVVINSGDIVVESTTAVCRSLTTKPGVQIQVTTGNNLTILY